MFKPGIESSDHDPGLARSPTIHAIEIHSEFFREAVPMGDFGVIQGFKFAEFNELIGLTSKFLRGAVL